MDFHRKTGVHTATTWLQNGYMIHHKLSSQIRLDSFKLSD